MNMSGMIITFVLTIIVLHTLIVSISKAFIFKKAVSPLLSYLIFGITKAHHFTDVLVLFISVSTGSQSAWNPVLNLNIDL